MEGGDLRKNKDLILIKEAFRKLSGDEIAALMRAFRFVSSENAPKPTPVDVSAMIQEETGSGYKLGQGDFQGWSQP